MYGYVMDISPALPSPAQPLPAARLVAAHAAGPVPSVDEHTHHPIPTFFHSTTRRDSNSVVLFLFANTPFLLKHTSLRYLFHVPGRRALNH